MSSIWCAWGDSESCVSNGSSDSFRVPERVAQPSCFALGGAPNAQCTYALTNSFVEVSNVNALTGYNPQPFYATLRVFVGPDVTLSVLQMRIFNVGLASTLFGLALAVSRVPVRRALALGWGIAIVPIGMFTIASTNPSSWAIMGSGVFWAFLCTFLQEPNWRGRRSLLAILGAAVSIVVALSGRSDSAYVIALSVVAVCVVSAASLRKRIRTLVPVATVVIAILVGIVVVSWNSRAGSLIASLGQVRFPPGDPQSDQPNAVVKTLSDLPSFLAGFFGGQAPSWSQRVSALDAETEGYSWPGFTYGLGFTDVAMPSLVWILVTGSIGAVIIIGFRTSSRFKIAALSMLVLGLVGEVLFVRALFAFQPGVAALQPRYFFPLILVIICFALIKPTGDAIGLNRLQAVVLLFALSIANVVAIRATMASYIHGQGHSWTQLADQPSWWWSFGPSPDQLTLLAAVFGILWLISAILLTGSDTYRDAKASKAQPTSSSHLSALRSSEEAAP